MYEHATKLHDVKSSKILSNIFIRNASPVLITPPSNSEGFWGSTFHKVFGLPPLNNCILEQTQRAPSPKPMDFTACHPPSIPTPGLRIFPGGQGVWHLEALSSTASFNPFPRVSADRASWEPTLCESKRTPNRRYTTATSTSPGF